MEKHFINREKTLKAIESRIDLILRNYKEEAEKITGNWTQEDREKFKDWNLYHDKKDKVTSLLHTNWSNYKDWHFETYQFNVY